MLMAASQLAYFIWYGISGAGGDKWPLYACRMAAVLLFFSYFIDIPPITHFATFTALYGGISSVFWSTPKPFAFPHITRIAFFGTHIFLAYAALLRIILHDDKFGKRELLQAEGVNLCMIAGVLVLDIKFDWNYMFLLTPQLPSPVSVIGNEVVWQVMMTAFVVCVYIFAVWASWFFSSWLQKRYGPGAFKGNVIEKKDTR